MSFDLGKISSLFKNDTATSDATGIIGVDVGSSSIKVVQLQNNKGVVTLTTYGELQLGPYDNADIGRNTRLRPDKLVEAFVDILREAAVTGRKVAVAISYNASFITVASIPTEDQEKIPQMIPVEARKYVPVPLTDVTLDWFPLATKPGQKSTKVLLTAVHNDALSRYDGMVHGADLTGVVYEVELFSTIRSVVSREDTTVAVVDFGSSSTRLYIVHNGVIGKTHSVPMCGADLTNAIMKARNIDFRMSEEIKRTQGLGVVADTPALEKAFVDILERGFREIHTVIKRYEEGEGVVVEKAILSGGSSLLSGLLPYAGDILNLPMSLANPFGKVAFPAFLEDTLKEAGPSFAVALGVALRGLEK